MKLVPIHAVKGYELFRDEDGPFVIREWTSYRTDARGVRVKEVNRMRLELVTDHFAGNQASREVFKELEEAWRTWAAWQQANTKG